MTKITNIDVKNFNKSLALDLLEIAIKTIKENPGNELSGFYIRCKADRQDIDLHWTD